MLLLERSSLHDSEPWCKFFNHGAVRNFRGVQPDKSAEEAMKKDFNWSSIDRKDTLLISLCNTFE